MLVGHWHIHAVLAVSCQCKRCGLPWQPHMWALLDVNYSPNLMSKSAT